MSVLELAEVRRGRGLLPEMPQECVPGWRFWTLRWVFIVLLEPGSCSVDIEEGGLILVLMRGARSDQSYVRVVRTGRIYPIFGSQSAYQKREDGDVRRT